MVCQIRYQDQAIGNSIQLTYSSLHMNPNTRALAMFSVLYRLFFTSFLYLWLQYFRCLQNSLEALSCIQTLADDIWHRKEKTEKYHVHFKKMWTKSDPGYGINISDQQHCNFPLKIKICRTVICFDPHEGLPSSVRGY